MRLEAKFEGFSFFSLLNPKTELKNRQKNKETEQNLLFVLPLSSFSTLSMKYCYTVYCYSVLFLLYCTVTVSLYSKYFYTLSIILSITVTVLLLFCFYYSEYFSTPSKKEINKERKKGYGSGHTPPTKVNHYELWTKTPNLASATLQYLSALNIVAIFPVSSCHYCFSPQA